MEILPSTHLAAINCAGENINLAARQIVTLINLYYGKAPENRSIAGVLEAAGYGPWKDWRRIFNRIW